MDVRRIERIERGAEIVGAALLAAAISYAALRFGPMAAVAAGAATFFPLFKVLQAIGPAVPTFEVQHFEPAALPPFMKTEEELLLTDLYTPEPEHSTEELVLDDVLDMLSSNSRVVRLFDRAAMPTPSELKSRIDRHLETAPDRNADASHALHEALADLRRSLG
jgi:hypothetical protein